MIKHKSKSVIAVCVISCLFFSDILIIYQATYECKTLALLLSVIIGPQIILIVNLTTQNV